MALPRLTSSEAVTRALDEFDTLERDPFLAKYGYGRAKRYFVERNGNLYDSKAIFGVALGNEYPDRGHVRNHEFAGGEGTVIPSLERLGFQIRDIGADGTDELVLPQHEVDEFAGQLSSPEYLENERNYKLAVHEVISRLLSPESLASEEFPTLLAAFFERKLDLGALGLDGEQRARIEDAVGRAPSGITNALVNLVGGGFGVNNFVWIPEATRIGLGEEIREAFRILLDDQQPLTDRVEGFRSRLYAIQEQSKAAGGFKPEWNLIKISLHFVAALLGSFDPSRFTFYHRGKLEHSYEEFVGPWPKQHGGDLYKTLCAFVQEVGGALRRQGAPIQDLIDAQSFLYLRAPAKTTEAGEAVATDGALHLVAKWSLQHGADTIQLHQDVVERHGEVWWGVIGTGERKKISDENLETLRRQVEQGVETSVYLAGPPDTAAWQTRLVDISPTRPANQELIPSYYPAAQQHSLWLKLSEFQQVEHAELLRSLEPKAELGRLIALGNQTNPLLVRKRVGPRVWWVYQGSSYDRARAGGYLWAPLRTKTGQTRRDHEALLFTRPGDVVLNYANGEIRAVSRVTGSAHAATRPDPDADQEWINDGRRLDIVYRELATPLPLSAIPEGERQKEGGPFDRNGGPNQGYLYAISDAFVNTLRGLSSELAALLPKPDETVIPVLPRQDYTEPSFEEIAASVLGQGLALTERTIRRYHLSLKSRGFVVLSGVSGTGKTWLAQAYASAVGAVSLVVSVAPNWTTNEDLLGYQSPINGEYRDTEFSRFLRDASNEWNMAVDEKRTPRPYHVILDEMNLARVEYYFAKFLSVMELRAREGETLIELAPGDAVTLGPNLCFVGTVNIDETTHLFSDKVFDRAQLVELTVDRQALEQHIGNAPYAPTLLQLWDLLRDVAPFAFRIVDEIGVYLAHAEGLDVSWEEALDEQIFQKLLPKLKGADSRVGTALEQLIQLSAGVFPLSHRKAQTMQEGLAQHGFSSYF